MTLLAGPSNSRAVDRTDDLKSLSLGGSVAPTLRTFTVSTHLRAAAWSRISISPGRDSGLARYRRAIEADAASGRAAYVFCRAKRWA